MTRYEKINLALLGFLVVARIVGEVQNRREDAEYESELSAWRESYGTLS